MRVAELIVAELSELGLALSPCSPSSVLLPKSAVRLNPSLYRGRNGSEADRLFVSLVRSPTQSIHRLGELGRDNAKPSSESSATKKARDGRRGL